MEIDHLPACMQMRQKAGLETENLFGVAYTQKALILVNFMEPGKWLGCDHVSTKCPTQIEEAAKVVAEGNL